MTNKRFAQKIDQSHLRPFNYRPFQSAGKFSHFSREYESSWRTGFKPKFRAHKDVKARLDDFFREKQGKWLFGTSEILRRSTAWLSGKTESIGSPFRRFEDYLGYSNPLGVKTSSNKELEILQISDKNIPTTFWTDWAPKESEGSGMAQETVDGGSAKQHSHLRVLGQRSKKMTLKQEWNIRILRCDKVSISLPYSCADGQPHVSCPPLKRGGIRSLKLLDFIFQVL